MTPRPLPGVAELGSALRELGWVTELLVGGSAAAGDHVREVSDLDLFAVVAGPVGAARQRTLAAIHAKLDRGAAAGARLGCAYIQDTLLHEPEARHPTWTHGRLRQRPLSAIAMAQLACDGYPVYGRPPAQLLPAFSTDDVRDAAWAELTGYWAYAVRRPWWWLDPTIAELGLTSMARGRHAMVTGRLLTKTDAIEVVDAPPWLIDRLRDRRRGAHVALPRLRAGYLAWRDARRTVAGARHRRPPSA